MEIEVKGHSGCQIDVVNEDGSIENLGEMHAKKLANKKNS